LQILGPFTFVFGVEYWTYSFIQVNTWDFWHDSLQMEVYSCKLNDMYMWKKVVFYFAIVSHHFILYHVSYCITYHIVSRIILYHISYCITYHIVTIYICVWSRILEFKGLSNYKSKDIITCITIIYYPTSQMLNFSKMSKC
jgi:hypothetical protein